MFLKMQMIKIKKLKISFWIVLGLVLKGLKKIMINL